MGKSLTEVAKSILLENSNAATLRPKSKSSDAPQKLAGEVEDLGDAVDEPTDVPASAKAALRIKKDTSKSAKAAVAAETSKKAAMAEELDLDEEDLDEGTYTGIKKKSKGDGETEVEYRGRSIGKMYQGRNSGRYSIEHPKEGGSASYNSEKEALRDLRDMEAKTLKDKRRKMEEDLDEEEQIDEVSKDTLKSYIKKAVKSNERLGLGASMGFTGDSKKKAAARMEKHKRRGKYIEKAVDKLEEDYIEEDIEISEELGAFIDAMLEEGYSEDQIAEAIEENFELVSEESEETVEEDSGYEVDMSEHVEALLAGEDLSEEFKAKAATIFEAAVKAKVEEEIARLEEAYAETLEEQIEEIQSELSESVDNYLGYVVEQWVQENEVAIESGLRSELTEEFIAGLRNLFSEHYIDIPEDKVSVVEEMATKVAQLEEKLNEEIERNVSLSSMINESKRFEILVDACEGLTDTQAEKLKALSEGVDFNSADEFGRKLNLIKESYFRSSVRTDNVLDDVESSTDAKSMISEDLSGPMAAYVKTLGRVVK